MATVNVRPLQVQIAARAVEEFCQRWLAGLNPSLSLETAPDGEVRVSCQVHAGGARRAYAQRYQGQHGEQRQVNAGGARRADVRRYRGQQEEQHRGGVPGVRYRGAAYERRLARRARGCA